MSAEHFGVGEHAGLSRSTILYPDSQSLKGEKPALHIWPARHADVAAASRAPSKRSKAARARVAVPSGLNAIATAIMAVCGAGDHLLMVDSCYGPTRHFCDKTLKRFGIETTYYDPLIGGGIAALFKPNTRAVFCESPGSLTFEVQDIPAIAARRACARRLGADGQYLGDAALFPTRSSTASICRSRSGTKYVGGHADVMIGYVTANESHTARLEDTLRRHRPLCSAATIAFWRCAALRTLPVRLKRHQETALKTRALAADTRRGRARASSGARKRSRTCALEARLQGRVADCSASS